MKKFYLTTAIDYVNSLPHIGTAYEKISADCIARAKRLQGYDVRFCMGTDEHSINVKKMAISEGLEPLEYCNRMVPKFKAIWDKLEISYDDFIRTTEERHKVSVTELFRRVLASGDIYTDVYKGWYCEGCEAFIQEKDLVDGKCVNHMNKPAWIEEQNYFFKLSKYGPRLLEHINANPEFIQPTTRRNEIIKLIEGGLEDISVSRSGFDWGIPLPGDDKHVVYVWFDAVINYISSLEFGSDNPELMDRYWPADLHIIGKDITRFHCVMWPAMLMSAGVPVQYSVFGHGFIYHRGEKMSKSLGNVVSPLDIADKFGADPLRYFLLREVVYGQDGDFTFDRFIERYNSDLANDLGNLLSRTVSMIGRYLDGVIPENAELPDNAVSNLFPEVFEKWTASMEKYELSIACDTAWDLIRAANKRVEDSAPWTLAKDPDKKDELVSVLYDLASVIARVAILIQPYIPSSADAIWKSIGITDDITKVNLDGSVTIPLAPKGVKLEKAQALFPRIEEDNKKEKTAPAAKKADTGKDTKDIITIDDFIKVDVRVGTVMKAEKVEKSDKLLRLQIVDGDEGRTILAGIAQHYLPEDIVGKQVAFIANLAPRKMMGEVSNGMVLAAGDNGKLSLLSPDFEVTPGSKVS